MRIFLYIFLFVSIFITEAEARKLKAPSPGISSSLGQKELSLRVDLQQKVEFTRGSEMSNEAFRKLIDYCYKNVCEDFTYNFMIRLSYKIVIDLESQSNHVYTMIYPLYVNKKARFEKQLKIISKKLNNSDLFTLKKKLKSKEFLSINKGTLSSELLNKTKGKVSKRTFLNLRDRHIIKEFYYQMKILEETQEGNG